MPMDPQLVWFIVAILTVALGGLALLVFVVSPMERRRAQAGAAAGGVSGAAGAFKSEEAFRAHQLKSQMNGAAVWLAMIGGFTLFNAIEWLTHQSTRMVIGLIATRLLTFRIVDMGDTGLTIELVAAIAAAVVFGVLAFFVYRRQTWALIAGTVLYAADFALFLVAVGLRDPMGLIFHAIAAGSLFGAYLMARKVKSASLAVAQGEEALSSGGIAAE